MSVREYIGARYVPVFSDPIQWDPTLVYEPLTVVMNLGASYVSRKSVPAGIQIDNTEYWILWADYNAQLQHYIDEVNTFDGRIDTIEDALPIANFDAVNTVDARFDTIESDEWVTTQRIDDDAVTTAKITDEAVTSAKLADDAVTTRSISDDSVTTAKIADGAITESKLASDALDSFYENILDTLDVNSFIYPAHVGILRIPTYEFNSSIPTNDIVFGQGLCVNGQIILQALSSANQNSAENRIYQRNLADNSSWDNGTVTYNYHASSIVYIPSIDKYVISRGFNGYIYVCNSTTFAIEQTVQIGSSAVLLGYDNSTAKLYGSDYGANLYEIDYSDWSRKTDLPGFANSKINGGNTHTLQDIDVENGIVYTMFSSPSLIFKYDLEGNFIENYTMPNHTRYYYIGELEGICVVDEIIYFSSTTYNQVCTTFYYTHVWKYDQEHPQMDTHDWKVATGNRSVNVSAPTTANLQGSQNAAGTNANPFPTINEAIDYMHIYGDISTMNIAGDHGNEPVELGSQSVALIGTNSDNTVDIVGRIQTIAGSIAVQHLGIEPRTATFANYINGYRNAVVVLNGASLRFGSGTPSTGHKVASQGYLKTDFSYTYYDPA